MTRTPLSFLGRGLKLCFRTNLGVTKGEPEVRGRGGKRGGPESIKGESDQHFKGQLASKRKKGKRCNKRKPPQARGTEEVSGRGR